MTGGSGGGGGATGFVAPTLELTVSGVHFGPAAPDAGSSASLITQRDGLGNALSSTFTLDGGLSSLGAGCSFRFDTFGGPTIGLGQYTISAATGSVTANGTVSPTGSESVTTPEGPASCAGTDCDGGALVISAIDAAHVYGYVSATLSAASGAGVADVVCTFYLPMSSYQP